MFHRWFCRVSLLGLAALTAAAPAPGGPPVHPKTHVQPKVASGPAALAYGQGHLGQAVTLNTAGNVVFYDPSTPAPAGAYFPACANFVWAALLSVGAKTTADFGVVDPPNWPPNTPSPTDYVWGQLVATYHPGTGDPGRAMAGVQPGDVLQFRNVTSQIIQHTAFVVRNKGGGRFDALDQNANGHLFVAPDTFDLSTMTGGTVWAYRPVPK